MPQKTWAVGEEVLAADFNTYVQNQTVPQFATTTERDLQWTAPPNGATCVTVDTYTTWLRQEGVWTSAANPRFYYARLTADLNCPASVSTAVATTPTFTVPTGAVAECRAVLYATQTTAATYDAQLFALGAAMSHQLAGGKTTMTATALGYVTPGPLAGVQGRLNVNPWGGQAVLAKIGTLVTVTIYYP